MHIFPNDVLPDGTKVRVGTRHGYVESSSIVPAVPSGIITIHTIVFTHKEVRGFARIKKLEPLPKFIRKKVNYSFIEIDIDR
jgi:hypothetical protein